MPTSRHQSELGLDREAETWMRRVYDRLARRRDLAYSSAELADAALGASPPDSKSAKFQLVLGALVWIGAVDTRNIDGLDYFAPVQEFDTSSWVPIGSVQPR